MPKLSAGRVQSVATRVVVSRERERMAFRQAEYWDLEGHFLAAPDEKDPTAPRKLAATLHSLDGRRLATGGSFEQTTGQLKPGADVVLLDEASARDLARRLEQAPFSVRSTDEKPYTAQAVRAVHDLHAAAGGRPQAALLRPAGHADRPAAVRERLHHLHAHRQQQPVGDGGQRRPPAGPRALRPGVRPDAPRRYASKSKNAQEAHEAIRPSGEVFRTPASWPASCPATSCGCTS
jgi:DNA topoisomerase-1